MKTKIKCQSFFKIKYCVLQKNVVTRQYLNLKINTITMKNMKIVLAIFGKPGSGKSILSEALKWELIDWFGIAEKDIKMISVGELLKREVENQTPLGIEIKEPFEKDQLVPQELINPFVHEYLKKHPAEITIIDGYPRSVGSVLYMQEKMSEEYSLAFIKSSVPDDVAAARLKARKEKKIYERLQEYHDVISPSWNEIVSIAPNNSYVVNGPDDFDRVIRWILRHILVNAKQE